MKISTYTLYARNGRKIKNATQVENNGHIIRFTEKLSKGQAISQFNYQMEKEYKANLI